MAADQQILRSAETAYESLVVGQGAATAAWGSARQNKMDLQVLRFGALGRSFSSLGLCYAPRTIAQPHSNPEALGISPFFHAGSRIPIKGRDQKVDASSNEGRTGLLETAHRNSNPWRRC